jgi:hypothetical protein
VLSNFFFFSYSIFLHTDGNKQDKVKERIRKGIPDALRGKVWPLLTGANDARTKQPELYQRLLLKPIARDDDIQIRKDLPRTFSFLFCLCPAD